MFIKHLTNKQNLSSNYFEIISDQNMYLLGRQVHLLVYSQSTSINRDFGRYKFLNFLVMPSSDKFSYWHVCIFMQNKD